MNAPLDLLALRIDAALAALRAGRPVIVSDDADREDEADLILAADTLSVTEMARMIRDGSGIAYVRPDEVILGRADAGGVPAIVDAGLLPWAISPGAPPGNARPKSVTTARGGVPSANSTLAAFRSRWMTPAACAAASPAATCAKSGVAAAALNPLSTMAQAPRTAAQPEFRIRNGRIRQSIMGWTFNPMPTPDLARHCRGTGEKAMSPDATAPPPFSLEPLPRYREYPPAEMAQRARDFHADIARRRTVRDFDTRPVPREVIESCLLAAGTAPSGANQQPWFFSVITDAARKQRIRAAAEAEEREFYSGRAPQEWLDALSPLGTDPNKPFLEEAPVLIAIFAQKYGLRPGGERFSHYYVPESVGIATGFLIAALHKAGQRPPRRLGPHKRQLPARFR